MTVQPSLLARSHKGCEKPPLPFPVPRQGWLGSFFSLTQAESWIPESRDWGSKCRKCCWSISLCRCRLLLLNPAFRLHLLGSLCSAKLLAAPSTKEFSAACHGLGVSLERQRLAGLWATHNLDKAGKEAARTFNFIPKQAPSSAPLSHLTFSTDCPDGCPPSTWDSEE